MLGLIRINALTRMGALLVIGLLGGMRLAGADRADATQSPPLPLGGPPQTSVHRPQPAGFDVGEVIRSVRRNRGIPEGNVLKIVDLEPAGRARFQSGATGHQFAAPGLEAEFDAAGVHVVAPGGAGGTDLHLRGVRFSGAGAAQEWLAPADDYTQVKPGLLRQKLPSGPRSYLLHRGRDGVELYWRLDAPPALPRSGVVNLTFDFAAHGRPLSYAEGWLFPAPAGRQVAFTHLRLIDRDGRWIEVRAEARPGGFTADGLMAYELRHALPVEFLRAAHYPLIIDPTIGPEFPLEPSPVFGAAPGAQTRPRLAFNGTNYLVVWQDNRSGTSSDIYGARVSAAGVVLDPAGIAISTATGNQVEPDVTAGAGGDFFAVWRDFRGGGTSDIYGTRLLAAGTVVTPAGVAIATGAGDQSEPAAAYNSGEGNYMVAFTDNPAGTNANIVSARISAAGVVSSAVTVSGGAQNEINPSITHHGTNYLIGWADFRSTTDYDIYAARVQAVDGVVIESAGFLISTAAGDQVKTAAARTTQSNVNNRRSYISWQDSRNNATTGIDIYAQRVGLDGSVTATVVAVSNASGDQLQPDVGASDDKLIFAWVQNGGASGEDIGAQRADDDGSLIGAAFSLSAQPGSQAAPALASNGAEYVAAWQDLRGGVSLDIYAARVKLDGTFYVPADFPVSTTPNAQQFPALASNGTIFLVAWEDLRAGATDIYAARVSYSSGVMTVMDANGIAVCTATGEQRRPAVASDGTDFVVVWEDLRGIDADIFGTKVGADGVVTTPGGANFNPSPATPAGAQTSPAIARVGTGYLTVWSDARGSSSDIYGTRVNAAGMPQDTAGLAIFSGTGTQTAPALAASGSFYLAAWQDDGGGAGNDIRAQLLDASGGAVGAPIVISAAADEQQAPAVAGAGGGSFVAAWQDARNNATTGIDIYAARITAGGVVQDATGVALSAAADAQTRPRAASDGTDTLVVWQDKRGGANEDIYGARLKPDGAALDGGGLLIEASAFNDLVPVPAHLSGGTHLIAYQRFYDVPGFNTDRVLARLWRKDVADLAITNSDGSTSAIPGSTLNYTINVTNPAGGDGLTGVSVQSNAPDLSAISWSCVPAGGATCPASGGGALSLAAAMPAGSSLAISLSGLLNPAATGSTVHTATVTAPYGSTDPSSANNSATDTDTLTPQANLSMTKTDEVDPVDLGGNVGYTLTITNGGPSVSTGVGVSDTLPPGMVLYSGDQTDNDDTALGFGGGVKTATQWNAGGWLELTAAGKTAGSGGFTSRVMDAGATAAWTSLAWTPRRPYGKPLPNDGISETAYAAGNASVVGIQLLLHLDENAGSTTPADFSGSARTVSCAPNCPVFGTAGKFNTAASFNGTTQFISVADSPSMRPATFSVEMWFNVGALATNDVLYLFGKDVEHYELFLETTATAGAPATLTFVPNGDPQTTTSAVGAVAPSSGWHHVVAVYADPVATLYLDGVQVATRANANGQDNLSLDAVNFAIGTRNNNQASRYFEGALDEVALYSRVLNATEIEGRYLRGRLNLRHQVRACLDAVCTATPFIGPDGTAATYYSEASSASSVLPTRTLTNLGSGRYFQYESSFTTADPARSPELVAVAIGPPHDSVTVSQGSCTLGNPLTCNLGTLAPGATATIQILVQANQGGTQTNTATVSATTPDPVSGNNSDSETTQINFPADLEITKTDGRVQTEAGLPVAYTLTVTNNGPAAVTGARVIDLVPAALQSPAWTCAASGGGTCAAGGSGNIDQLVNLPNGAAAVFTLTGVVSQSATGNLVNSASVSVPAGITDLNLANNSATDSDAIVLPPPPTITLLAGIGGARSGHTATLLHTGKILLAGGTVNYTSGQSLNTAVVYDPVTGVSTPTVNTMSVERAYHAATLLTSGKVLITGGQSQGNASSVLAAAELYDPATGSFTALPALRFARRFHTATLLLDGRVLIVAGEGTSNFRSDGELFDPAAGDFTLISGDTLGTGRGFHTATLLPDGRVLVAGGLTTGAGAATGGAEIYNPAASGNAVFTATGSMGAARGEHTATLLADGRLFVAGGRNGGATLSSSELFTPASGLFAPGPTLAAARYNHMSALLPDNRVMLAGGANSGGYLTAVELFSPGASLMSGAGVNLNAQRFSATATLMPGGRVLITGGYNGSNNYFDSADRYDPPPEGRSIVAPAVVNRRFGHQSLPLADGTILIVGGRDGATYSTQAEIYDADANSFTSVLNDSRLARTDLTLTLLVDGRVLIAGGSNAGGALNGALLYNPITDTLTNAAGGTLNCARSGHTATLLQSGKVLLAGGCAGQSSAEIFDPFLNALTLIPGGMQAVRARHDAVLLPSGKVLLTGGYSGSAALASSEVYDPGVSGLGLFNPGANLGTPRYDHGSSLLPGGKVLVLGGTTDGSVSLASTELIDPAAGVPTFAAHNPMATARRRFTSILLPRGKLLVAGGINGAAPLNSVENYDPANGLFTGGGSLGVSLYDHSAALLINGRILIFGGTANGAAALPGAELFGPNVITDPARRPALNVPDPGFAVPGKLVLTGAGFRGGGEGSEGGTANSSTGFPLVRMQRLDNEQVIYLSSDEATPWSDALFTSATQTDATLPFGFYRTSVIANGIASQERIISSPYRPIQVDAQSPPNGEVTLPYAYQPTFTGGFGAQVWSITGLPSGMTYDPATGYISGTPTVSGPVTVTVTVTDSQGLSDTRALNTFTIYSALTITTFSLPGGTVGSVYSPPAGKTITTSGGAPGKVFAIATGLTPSGLSLSPAGVISGIPLAPGTVNFSIKVTDSLGKVVTRPYTITVIQPLSIVNSALAVGVLGETYPYTTLQATGGFPQYNFSIAGGSLPPGLSLAISGQLTGKPTATGNFPVTFRVTDSTNATTTRAYTLVVTVPSDINGWTPRGQFGGKIQEALVSPDYAADQVVFVLSEAGELFRSADKGLSWSRSLINPSKAYNSTNHVLISPVYSGAGATAAARTLFFHSFEIGVWKSIDHGATFSESNAGLPCVGPCSPINKPQIVGMALSPAYGSGAGQTLWAIDYESNLHRSTDGGTSWVTLSTVQPLSGSLRTLLAVSPNVAADQTIFVGLGNKVYRSTDGGLTWPQVYNVLDGSSQELIVKGLVISPNYASDHTLLIEAENFRLFRTRNGGGSYADISTPGSNYGQHLSVIPRPGLNPRWTMESPNSSAFVYKLLYSDDYGTTFTALYANGMSSGNEESFALAASPWLAGPQTSDVFYGTEQGLYASFDGGFTFIQRDEGLSANVVHGVSGSGDDVAAAYKGGWFKSADLALSRVRLSPPDASGTARDVYFGALSPDYANDNVIFLGDALGLTRSDDGGQSFTPVSGFDGSTESLKHGFAPGFSGATGTLFISNETGLYKSVDGGRNFSLFPLSPECGGSNPVVISLAVSPNYGADQTLYVVTAVSGSSGGLCRSVNGGASWTQVKNGLVLIAGGLALSPNYHHLLGVNGTAAKTLMVNHLKSSDGGLTWAPVTGGPASGSGSPVFSPGFASDGTAFLFADGVWRSTNGAAAFAPLGAGPGTGCTADALQTRTVTGLYLPADFNPSTGEAAASTNGSGIWRSANGGQTFCIVTESTSINSYVNNVVRVPGGSLSLKQDDSPPTEKSVRAAAIISVPGSILAATEKQGVFQSDDGGVTFRNISAGLPANANTLAVSAPELASDRPLTAVLNQGLWRYEPSASSWQQLPAPYDSGKYTSFFEDGTSLYATRADGVSLRSVDGGNTWTQQDPTQLNLVGMDYSDATTLTTVGEPSASVVGPRQADYFTAVTASLWAVSESGGPRYSLNSGSTWTPAPGTGDYVFPPAQVFKVVKALGINTISGGRDLLVGTTTGLYRSIDGGANWRSASAAGSGLEATSKNFAALLSTPTAFGTTDILAGAVGSTTGGVYLSGDGGEHWTQINQGFDPNNLAISTLVKTSCSGCPVQYYSGSYGSGVYTRTITVNAPPSFAPVVSGGWCFGSTSCACSTAPGSGPAQGGQDFKLCGANFQTGAAIEFDGAPVNTAACSYSATVITCTAATPPHPPGPATIRVRNPDTRAGIVPVAYQYTAGVPRAANSLRVYKSGLDALLNWTCSGCSAGSPAQVYRSQNALFNLYLENYNGGTGGTYTNTGVLAPAANPSYFWTVE